ncbi:hypothetical protein ACIPW4_27225 [Pseudomonas sp. NPDC089996]|uniref:hypothetical protein n=1 Tax=Pseudomonas sp. NPDC089996 TaxID=3364474 RepID=UPI003822AF37
MFVIAVVDQRFDGLVVDHALDVGQESDVVSLPQDVVFSVTCLLEGLSLKLQSSKVKLLKVSATPHKLRKASRRKKFNLQTIHTEATKPKIIPPPPAQYAIAH